MLLKPNGAGEVLFQVKDQGPGLSEEDYGKLFKKFESLAPKPTGGESSTGLGLSIVKQLVDLHGGAVWCDTVEGEGSTFSIRLPVDRSRMEA